MAAIAPTISFRLLSRLLSARWRPGPWIASLAERIRATGWCRPLRRWALHRRAARAAVTILLAASALPVSAALPVSNSSPAAAGGAPPAVGADAVPAQVPAAELGLPLPDLGAVGPTPMQDEQWYERWLGGLQFVGQKTFNYRAVSVTGSEAAKRFFRNESPYYANLSHFSVMGRLLDRFDINMTFADGPYGVDQQRMSIRYRRGGTQFTAGDISGALAGNGLVPLNRTLRALLLERQISDRTKITALVSEARAATRRVDIPGNNTVGPYYLNAFPIVVDSVRVRIDELEVPRDSFVVDASAGTITFRAGLIVPQTSAIHVSFESYSDGAPLGTMWGVRASHSLGASGSIGATFLMAGSEESPEADGDRERTDDWSEGHADSNGPYHLRYGPIARGSEEVYVAGVRQQPNRDYYIQYDRGVIQFTRIILSSEHIRVTYRQVRDGQLQDTLIGEGIAGPYRLAQTPVLAGSETVVRVTAANVTQPQIRDVDYRIDYATGTLLFLREPLARGQSAVVLYRPQQRLRPAAPDRMIGLDGSLAIGKHTRLSAQFAESGARGGASGRGMTLEARTGLLPAKFNGGNPRLTLGATLKKIDPDFTTMESVGFQRNEKGLALDGEFLLNEHVRFFSRWDRSRRPLGFGAALDTAALYDTTQSHSGVTFTHPHLPELSFQRLRLDTDGPGGATSQQSDSLQLRYNRKRLSLGAEYLQTENRGAIGLIGLGTPAAADSVVSSKTTKLFASYRPASIAALSASLADSDIESGGKSSQARNVDLNAVVTPVRGLQITADYRVSDAGTALGDLPPVTTGWSGSGSGILPPLEGTGTGIGGVRAAQFGAGYSIPGGAGGALGGPAGYGGAVGFGSGYGGVIGGYGASYGGLSGGYGASYYGGNSTSRRLGISFTPGSRLGLNVQVDRLVSELYGNTDGQSFGFTYAPGRHLSLAGTVTQQRSTFVHPDLPTRTDAAMSSDLLFLSLRAGPFRKLTLNLDFQDMRTNNTSGLAGSLPAMGLPLLSPAAVASNIQTITGRLSYPIGAGHVAFAQLQHADYGGSQVAARKKTAAVGVEFALNRIMGVTLGVELHDYRDALRRENSYRARLVNANLAARF